MVKTRILRHKAWAVAIAILVAMPLIAAPFDKAGTVVLAELVSLVVTVGGAALKQGLSHIGATALAGEDRHTGWGNLAVATALIFIALFVVLSVVESIAAGPLSEANDNTSGRSHSLSEGFDNSASPWSSRLSTPCPPSSQSSTVPSKLAAHRSPHRD